MPDIAQLTVKITADAKKAEDDIDKVNKKVKEAGGSGGKGWKGMLQGALSVGGGILGAAGVETGIGAIKDQIVDMYNAGLEANRMDSLLAQGLKSTGDASGQTVDSLDKLSTSIMNHTGIDDDAVKSGEQMLLTFRGIGPQAFGPATQAVADMATRMNGGLIPSAQQMNQTALQLGKALNDPAQGLTMLRREGVTFTQQQQDQIKAMVKGGNVAGAQAIMLQELQKEFGGSAEAAGKANGGIAIMNAQMDNAKQTIGQALVPAVASITTAIAPLVVELATHLAPAISNLITYLDNNKPVLIAVGAVIGTVLVAAFVAWAISAATAAVATIAAAAPVLAVAAGIGVLIAVILLLVNHWGQVSAFFGGFKDALGNLLGVIGNFVGAALGAIGDFAGQAIDLFLNIEVRWPLAIAGAVLGMLGHLKDLAVQGLATIVGFVTDVIGPQGIGGLPQKFTTLAGQMLQGFIQGILQGTANVLGSVRNFGSSVVNALKGFLGIHSPSTMFASIGSDSAAGYAQGISSMKGAAASAAQGVGKAAAASMDSPANRDAAYAAGEALIQSLADGTYAAAQQANFNAGQNIIASTKIGKGAPRHFASGGLITEPVVGYGQRSGALYTFAENGPETVVPNLYGAAAASQSSAGGGSLSGASAQPIILQVDGRTLAQILLPHTVQQIRNAAAIRHM